MTLLDLLFPKKCLTCEKVGRYLCTNCISKVRKAQLSCVMCTKPSIDGMTHSKCKKQFSIDGVYAPFNYEGVVRKGIVFCKYRPAYKLSYEFSDILFEILKKDHHPLPKTPLLVPIPLYKKREKQRGFNQSELTGNKLAKKMGWSFVPEILVRTEFKSPQVELRGKERRQNILGAFAFNKTHQTLITKHSTLIIFDDVSTTGSTLKEAAKVLKRNGAGSVWGLTIAR